MLPLIAAGGKKLVATIITQIWQDELCLNLYKSDSKNMWCNESHAAFTPGHMLPDTCCIHLYPLVAVYIVSCIGDKIVASLSPVCCWIQRDTSRPWHKWTVIMSPWYSLQVSRTSNLYPATCIRHLVSGYKLLVRETCIRPHVSWCKRGLILLVKYTL